MTRVREDQGGRRGGGWARRLLQGAVVVAVASSMPAAWSAGVGGGVQMNNVAAGAAAITQQGNVTTIRTSSQNTIINYQRLSVGSGETLQFLQPSAASRVLNRIQGPEPTVIDGTLVSNGRVYLVNPAGVMFGNGAVVNVGALYAAAGHISDGDFMAGINQFTDNTGAVRNQGVITAGQIHLVGGSVANFGQIVTSGDGIVTLTAGKDVYIGESDSPTGQASVLVKVSSDKSATKTGTGVSNSGTVDAGGGALYLGAGDLYAAGIYNNGTLKGKEITLDSGASTNVNGGTIDAHSAAGRGGTVELLGDQVGVFAGTVDASGAAGGGTILVGGDVHGGGGVPVSTMAVVADGATLRADATGTGDGGKIVVFASDTVRVGANTISVVGAGGGSGGFVETSGLVNLTIGGPPAVGKGGTWLIDPYDLTISNGASANVTASFTAIGSGANVNVNDLATALGQGGGAQVTIATGTGGAESGNITLIDPLAFPGSGNNKTATLTLAAAGTIVLQGSITTTGSNNKLEVDLSAPGGAQVGGLVSTNGAAFNSSGGAFTLGGTITTGGGNMFLNHSAGAVTIGGIINLGGGTLTARAGSINQSGNAPITADTIALTLNGDAGLNATGNAVNSLSVVENAPGASVSFTDGANLSLLASTLNGANFTATDGGTLTVNGSVANTGSGGTLSLIATDVNLSAALAMNPTGAIVLAPLTANETIGLGGGAGTFAIGGGLLTIQSAGTLTFGRSDLTGNVAVGTVNLTGASLGLVSILGGSGTVTLTDGGAAPALLVPGDAALAAGAILAAHATNGVAEIKTTGGANILLAAGGAIGTGANRIEIDAGGAAVRANAGAGVFLRGIGAPGSLTFEGNSTAAGFDLLAAGNINAAGGGGTLTTTTGTIVLNATGGIGTTGALGIFPGTTASLTTHGVGAAGNIHILAPAAATLGSYTFTTAGAGTQTDTIDGAGDLTVTGAFAVPGDAVALNAAGNLFVGGASISGASVTLTAGAGGSGALNATGAYVSGAAIVMQAAGAILAGGATLSGAAQVTLHAGTGGTGNLDLTGAAIRGDALALTAGVGLGAAAVTLTGATLSGFSNPAPLAVRIEQDADLAGIPALGTTTALTAISHLGNMTLSGPQSLASLAAQALTIYLAGNATVSGNMAFTGNVQLAGNTTLAGTGGASNLTVTGTVAAVSGGGYALTTSFRGVTTFSGGSDPTPGLALGALTVAPAAGGSVVFGNGSGVTLTATGGVTVGENAALNGALTVASTGGGPVTFGGTINSLAASAPAALTVSTLGPASFQGNAGLAAPLGGLTVNGGGLAELGNGGAVALTTDSPMLFTGDVLLAANTTLTAAGGATGTVTFDKTVSSTASGGVSKGYALTINAGGSVTLQGAAGVAGGELGALAVNAPAGIFLGNGAALGVNTAPGLGGGSASQSFTGPVTLLGDTTLTAAGGTRGAITVAGLISSGTAANYSLTVNSAGTMALAGGTSTTPATELGSIQTLGGGATKFGGGGAVSVITTGTQSYAGPVALLGDTTFQGAGLAFGGSPVSLAAGTFDLTLISDALTFGGGANSVTGSGHLALSPMAATDNILINATGGAAGGTLVIAAGVLADFTGFALATLGRPDGSGTVTVAAAAAWKTPALLEAASGGTILAAAPLSTAGSLGLAAGTVSVTAAVTATGGFFDASSGVFTVGPGGSIGTTNAGVTIANPDGLVTLDGPIAAGAGAVTVTGLGITTGAAGAITGGAVTLNAGATSANLAGAIAGSGPVRLYGAGVLVATTAAITGLSVLIDSGADTIFLDHSLATNGSDLILQGAVLLGGGGAITLQTYGTGAGNISITGTVDATTNEALNLAAKNGTYSGNVSLLGVVGGATPLGALNVSGGSFTINSNITTAGPINLGNAGHWYLAHNGTAAGVTIVTGGAAFSAAGAALDASGAGATDLTLNTSATGGAAGPITLGGAGAAPGAGATLGNLTLIATGAGGDGTIQLAGATLGGALTSAGGAFSNSGKILAQGIALAQSGAVTINGALSAPGFAVSITGAGIASGAAGPMAGSTVSLNGMTGAVALSAPVTAANGFWSTSSGAFTLGAGGGIATANAGVAINHTNGLVTINSPIAAGNGAVSVAGLGVASGTAGALAGGPIALDGGAANVALLGPVAAAGSLTIAGNGISTGALAALTAASATLSGGAGAVALAGAVNATNGFVSAGSGLFTLAATGAINTGQGAVTISQGGLITLAGPVGAGAGSVFLTGAGVSQTGGAITAAQLTLAGTGFFNLPDANAAGTLTANVNGALTFANGAALTVAELTTQGGALTLTTATGNLTFSGTASAGALALTAANVRVNATLSGTLLTVAGALTTTDAVTLSGAATVNGNAALGAALTTTGAGSAITITGDAGGSGALAGGGDVNIGGGFSAAGGIHAGGSVTIGGPVTMTSGGTITAGASINLNGGANMAGNLNAGANIVAGGGGSAPTAITGDVTAGGSVAFTGPGTIAGAYNAQSISIPGALTLAGAATLKASGAGGILLGAVAGANENLTLQATSPASNLQVGAIGGDGAPIGDVAFDSDGLVTLGGSIYGRQVGFASGAGGALAAVPGRATIVNNGDLTIVAQETVTMALNEKLTVYDAAKINSAANDPGAHATGALLIWARSTAPGAVVLGDVNTVGRLVVAAGTAADPGGITLQNRPAAAVAGAATPLDLGADIFALGLVSDTFTTLPNNFTAATGFTLGDPAPVKFLGLVAVDNTHATPLAGGGLPRVLIGTRDATDAEALWFAPAVPNQAVFTNQLFAVNESPLPSPSSFVDPGSPVPPAPPVPRLVRDILVTGGGLVPAEAIGTVVPRDTQTITPEPGTAVSGALLESLREIGIYARELRTDELLDYLLGRGLYDDVPRVLDPGGSDFQVAVNRLPYAPVLPVVEAARALLYQPATDDQGRPIMERGKPKMISRIEDVSKTIGAAWQAYLDDMTARNQEPKPGAFRGYLEAHERDGAKFALALNYLNQIRDLLHMIKGLGITPKEYQVSEDKLLSQLCYQNVDLKAFPQMIEGPSTRPGGATAVAAPPAPAAAPK